MGDCSFVGWSEAPTEACVVIPAGQQQAVAVSVILNSTANR